MKNNLIKSSVKKILNKFLNKFIIYSHKPNVNYITLTFDDGPSENNTQLILKTLKDENVKVIFFVLGKFAVLFPNIIKQIHDDGHEIGIHGYEHLRASSVSTKLYINGILKTHKIIQDIVGSRTSRLFRPPYGDITLMSFFYLIMHGYKYVMWNYDSQDSFVKVPNDLANYLKDNKPLNGSICLFHDDYSNTAMVLSEVINEWKLEGREFRLITK